MNDLLVDETIAAEGTAGRLNLKQGLGDRYAKPSHMGQSTIPAGTSPPALGTAPSSTCQPPLHSSLLPPSPPLPSSPSSLSSWLRRAPRGPAGWPRLARPP